MSTSRKDQAAETFGSADLDPMITAAWLYYHNGMTQAEIATQLKVSRPAVANLLSEARKDGFVTISLRPDLLSRMTLASEVKKRYGLSDALIVPTPETVTPGKLRRAVGKATAMYLESVLRPGDVLATAWGATVLDVAEALTGKKVDDMVLAQAIGCLGSGDTLNPIHLANIMGMKLGARIYHLPLPAIVESREVRDILLSDKRLSSGLDMARSATLALVGVGPMSAQATTVTGGFFEPFMLDKLRTRGVVGDMSCRFFDIQGNFVETEFDDRIISLTLEELKGINPVVAATCGPDKVSAILGALRTGCMNVLITDEQTARQVLEMDDTAPLKK